MKPISSCLGAFVLALLFAGCSPEREIDGQIFVVTESRANIKMGLVGVHVVTKENIQPVAAALLEEYKAAELKKNIRVAQANEDEAALTQLEKDLTALDSVGLDVPAIARLKAASVERRDKLGSVPADAEADFLVSKKALEDRLFDRLPEPTAKTDADGHFTLKAKPGDWLLAHSSRTLIKSEEVYVWATSLSSTRGEVLISNDSLIDAMSGLSAFLGMASGLSPVALPTKPVTPSAEVSSLVKDSISTAGLAIAKATNEAAQAIADSKAAARLATEKRVEWTGAQMKRCGFQEDQINRVLTHGGTLVVWGNNKYGECDVPAGLSDVVAIATGSLETMAVKSDGTVVAWGIKDGRCNIPKGLNGVVSIASIFALRGDGKPVMLKEFKEPSWHVPADLSGVMTISENGCMGALKGDGTVVEWGFNEDGRCEVPVDLRGVIAISVGEGYTVALKNDGTVVAWGGRLYKRQCDVPTGLRDVIAISAGDQHALALKRDGTVVAWGSHYGGGCNVPVGLSEVVAIAAGSERSIALRKDGTVVAWGDNDKGTFDVPKGLSGVVAIAAGSNQFVALRVPEAFPQ